MSWIAISGSDQSWLCPRTFDVPVQSRDVLLSRGTIMLETRLSPFGRPQKLLAYSRTHPWNGSIVFQALPSGAVVLVMTHGEDVFHTVLQQTDDTRTEVLRISFSWDSEARFGQIAVERPESDTVVIKNTPPPPPLVLEDVFSLVRRPQLCEMDEDLVFFAVSKEIEPIGPMPSVIGKTPVLTPYGYKKIADLKTGDTIRALSGDAIPVLSQISRLVPALGSFQPVRLRAPYFGLRKDVVVAPHQRLVIGGSEVEYTFGREAVLVPALSLVNGFAAVYERGHPMVRYHDLLLPTHQPYIAAGAAVESLYIGRLRRRRAQIAQTLLAECPSNLLPEHARTGLKVLKPFEAITLAEARAA